MRTGGVYIGRPTQPFKWPGDGAGFQRKQQATAGVSFQLSAPESPLEVDGRYAQRPV